MIQPNECRIGNLVIFEKRVYKIYSICPEYPHLETDIFGHGVVSWQELYPVKINEQALINLKFKVDKGWNLTFTKGSLTIVYYTGSNNWWAYTGKEMSELMEIKYIHELQNAYYLLFKKELELKK